MKNNCSHEYEAIQPLVQKPNPVIPGYYKCKKCGVEKEELSSEEIINLPEKEKKEGD